jgi:hypothetical protein
MDENANTDRSPFRRFPYIQLVFCIAYLSMTTWTWMRFSYAWEEKPGSFAEADYSSLQGNYLSLRGKPIIRHSSEFVAVERPCAKHPQSLCATPAR